MQLDIQNHKLVDYYFDNENNLKYVITVLPTENPYRVYLVFQFKNWVFSFIVHLSQPSVLEKNLNYKICNDTDTDFLFLSCLKSAETFSSFGELIHVKLCKYF